MAERREATVSRTMARQNVVVDGPIVNYNGADVCTLQDHIGFLLHDKLNRRIGQRCSWRKFRTEGNRAGE